MGLFRIRTVYGAVILWAFAALSMGCDALVDAKTPGVTMGQGATEEELRQARPTRAAVSADGRFAAFTRLDSPEIGVVLVDFKTMSTTAYSIQTQHNRIEGLALSPDGAFLAVVLGGIDWLLQDEIWLFDAQGNVTTRIGGSSDNATSFSEPGRELAAPCFSPSGNRVAFFSDMVHQYARPERVARADALLRSPAMAVHELDTATQIVRLIDLPILPLPFGCYYASATSLVGIWNERVTEPEFTRLPVDRLYITDPRGGFAGNYWMTTRWRFEQTIGQAELRADGSSQFQKFEFVPPPFMSIRDKFRATTSPSGAGFLAILTLYDQARDPTLNGLRNRSYRPTEEPAHRLAWLEPDGRRLDVQPYEGMIYPVAAAGSANRRRIVVWAGKAAEPDDIFASQVGFPWTTTDGLDWEIMDLTRKYRPARTISVSPNADTVMIVLPQLIDRNGVGKTADYEPYR